MSTPADTERAIALGSAVADMVNEIHADRARRRTSYLRALDWACDGLERATGIPAEEWRSPLLARAAVTARGEVAATRAA